MRVLHAALALIVVQTTLHAEPAAQPGKRYYAHPAVEDQHGVIAPWYTGLNGQCDYRVRIAAETLKRYPWADAPKTGSPAPDYMYNGRWKIAADGTITPQPQKPWNNGDRGQREAFSILGWINYYRYSGDPAAIAHVTLYADLLTRHCQTDSQHPWPNFLISVPTHGESYGSCDPNGMIQLDIAAQVGLALVRAHQLTGNDDWLAHAKHWADLIAANRSRDPKLPPWNRYARPQNAFWDDLQTGGVFMILELLDALIELGYTGRDEDLVAARDAGLAYVRDVLLPRWTEPDTFGRHYWDWDHPVQCEVSTETLARYMIKKPERFPNWVHDVRNITTLFIHHACTSMESRGDVYSGAWAYPEGPACCQRSLWYAPLQVGSAIAEYGVRADSEWAREMARRQFILQTYDIHPTGVVEDNIDGGGIVADGWFKIVGPMALRFVLEAIAWLPETLGANRENHICRSSAVVRHVVYAPGRVSYRTAETPREQRDVLRLAFRPTRITADGRPLEPTDAPAGNGYQLKELSNGDWIVTVRHDGLPRIVIEGDDPQKAIDDGQLALAGAWQTDEHDEHFGRSARAADRADAEMRLSFEGNQFRIIGAVGPEGGQADVWIDGVKQLCGIDCWNPRTIRQQVIYYANGLAPGEHTVKVAVRGSKNPLSAGTKVWIDAVQYSAASGDAGFGSGGGPTGRQAWILGYPEREPYIDSKGRPWLPATEIVVRTGETADPVAQTWYARPKRLAVAGTDDPQLYRYGMHAKEFTAYVTVAPGRYRVTLKFMERRRGQPRERLMNVYVNDRPAAVNIDVAASALKGRPTTMPETVPDDDALFAHFGGLFRAFDLVLDDVAPANGVIAVRLAGVKDAEAILSALEVVPQPPPQ